MVRMKMSLVLSMVEVEPADLVADDVHDANVNGEGLHVTMHVGASSGASGGKMMLTNAFVPTTDH